MTNSTDLLPAVRVELGARSYDIRFFDDASPTIAAAIRPFAPEAAFVVSNETIWHLHGPAFESALREAGIRFSVALIGDGEKHKTLETASALFDRLIQERFSRRACVIALGGGVVGDLAGFVAATYLRGVSFVQVPTTVVSMVDSSVGGKTGVDHPLGKNLIGAFYQPKLVAMDVAYLRTLDDHNLTGGFAEVIKYGMIYDRTFFEYLEQHIEGALVLDPSTVAHIVRRSCEIKADVVSQDETESGLRAILNFGHTIGHAVEAAAAYGERQFHGQGVAIGMVAACELGIEMGFFTRDETARLEALLKRARLPVRIPAELKTDELLDRMKSDKKVAAGKIRFVLPHEIGKVAIHADLPSDAVRRVIERQRESK